MAFSPLDFSPPAALHVHVALTAAGQPPASPRLPLAFEPFLFLTPAHQALQEHGCPVLAFFLEDEALGYTVAQFYVAIDFEGPGLARSPGQASFGGVQLAQGLPASAVQMLLDAAEAALRQHGQTRLEIRSYATCYDPTGAATLAEALSAKGYLVTLREENYYLDLGRDYAAHLTYNERHCLRKCVRAGFVLEQEPPYLLPLAYEFMAACRQERGQKLSLPLERVQALFRAFPRQHLLLSVREPTGDWAAVLIAIRTSEHAFYDFYLASPLRLNKLSPAVQLLGGLHAFAQANEARIVDLGTSTLPSGEPNQPLLNFKRHLGGLASPRLTWQKSL
ncbi:hypothetical protein FNT36_15550 [Hymenobacter setariae]|uniref:Uncharacterized protein n=1 Tax=Hymenobacter setariae TaxID=2594794 RepID=A0A558BRC8_9BACT|nr:hypothetical protein [Hymenobacter setariae]TVT39077.1 hypothetical protein FNT36_15550 [Hymenobacter setariae]